MHKLVRALTCLSLTLMFTSGYAAAENIVFPTDPGIINVKSPPYNAVGNGIADDTAAIQAAISAHIGNHDIIYFPNGTYRVSNTLEWKDAAGAWGNELTLQGQSEAGTIIRLVDNCTGFTSATTPKPVIRTASTGTATSGDGNTAFRNNIKNLTVNTGTGNLGAVGIDYLTSNLGVLRHVTVTGTGLTGIRMNRSWPGPGLIKNVSVNGFQYGMTLDFHYQYGMTLEHVTLTNQTVAGILTKYNPVNIRKLTSVNTVPAIRITGDHALVVITDSSLTGGASANAAIVKQGKLYLRNTTVSGYGKAVDDTTTANLDRTLSGTSELISQYVSHAVEKEWTENPNEGLGLEVNETPTYVDGATSTWANGLSYGMTRNGNDDDDTAAIQAAMNSGNATVYLPRGAFRISNTITIPATVRHVLGANTYFDQRGTAFNSATSPKPIFKVVGTTSNPLIIENMWFGGTFGAGTIGIEHASTRKLAVLSSQLTSLNSKHAYINSISGGEVYFEDVLATRVVITGNQKMWGRQLNAEFGSVTQLVNDGGTVWVLGFKTEGSMTATRTLNGGFTEILGGFIYPNGGDVPSTGASIHEVVDANFSGSWVTNGYQYSKHVTETRNGVTRILYESEVPTRGGQEAVPLFVGYTERPEVAILPSADASVRDGSYASTNYGSDTSMMVKKEVTGFNREAFIKFNISGLSASGNYTLVLPVSSMGTATNQVNAVAPAANSWTELGLTWNNRPAVTAPDIATWTPAAGAEIQLNVTSAIQGALANSASEITFKLYSTTNVGSQGSVLYGTKENSDPSLRSVLMSH